MVHMQPGQNWGPRLEKSHSVTVSADSGSKRKLIHRYLAKQNLHLHCPQRQSIASCDLSLDNKGNVTNDLSVDTYLIRGPDISDGLNHRNMTR
jgi:hypothetical protein